MSVTLQELEQTLNDLLHPEQFTDYCPNGLQVQGRPEINKLVSGVTASQALIEAASTAGADAILVHHGYFWRGEDQTITGMKRQRIATLLNADISLFAYHLPLDAHAELGNNAQLGELLQLQVDGELGQQNNHPLGLTGTLGSPLSIQDFAALLNNKLERQPLAVSGGEHDIKRVAWCTGAAQNFIGQAVAAGVDAYVTGEASEQTVHIARESGIHFFAAGHHATERYGVQAVADYLVKRFAIEHTFIDIDNPV
ncbi:MAG: Nif3-like dinuclear metal center hexameric protein [Pseudohongiellaceae bacterium]